MCKVSLGCPSTYLDKDNLCHQLHLYSFCIFNQARNNFIFFLDLLVFLHDLSNLSLVTFTNFFSPPPMIIPFQQKHANVYCVDKYVEHTL